MWRLWRQAQQETPRGKMNMSKKDENHKKLVQLIRRIAKDVFYELMDEHLTDHEHKEKPAEEVLDHE